MSSGDTHSTRLREQGYRATRRTTRRVSQGVRISGIDGGVGRREAPRGPTTRLRGLGKDMPGGQRRSRGGLHGRPGGRGNGMHHPYSRWAGSLHHHATTYISQSGLSASRGHLNG